MQERIRNMWSDRSKRDGVSVWRQRWREAYSSVLAFQRPSYILDGRHSIRSSADDLLLSDESFIQLAPLLSPVLPINIKDNEVTKHLAGEARMSATVALIVQVLTAKLGQGRAVLVFEDVHWMDSSSWAVLRAALDAVQPMLVLLTLRPVGTAKQHGAKMQSYDAIVKHHSLCEGAVVELDGLRAEELQGLLCEQLSVDEIPIEFLKIVTEKSGGNPFWALEFIRSMRDSGVLLVEDSKCEFRVTFDKIEFPSSVEALITSRMDRLPANEQLLMKMGSVMGSGFSTRELGFLGTRLFLDLPVGQQLIDELDKLCGSEMLLRDRQEQYKFKHKYLQDVSYSLLPEELKEKLHRAAAEYYETSKLTSTAGLRSSMGESSVSSKTVKPRRGGLKLEGVGGAGEDLVWKLSYHWSHAGDAPDAVGLAVRYLTLAGDAALDNFSHEEARTLVGQALALSMRSNALVKERGPLQRRMAVCHKSVGEIKECRTELMSAIVALGGEKSEGYAEWSEREFQRRYRWLRMRHTLLSFFRPAPKRAATGEGLSDAPPQLELAIAYELLAQVCMQEHQREQAGYCAMRSLTLGQSLPNLTPVVGRAYASLCLVESAGETTD